MDIATITGLLKPGKLIEVHGDETTPIHDTAMEVVRSLQEDGKLVCYVDGGGKSTLEYEDIDPTMIWYVFNMDILDNPSDISIIADNCDAIVIDDITMYEGNPWKALEALANIARKKCVAIMVLNQRRHVFNYTLKEYEDKPFRLNVMQRYCDTIVDLNTGELEEACTIAVEYDGFIQELIQKAS